jgi:multisubunit Na+/H+ antiporter MnhE subunit
MAKLGFILAIVLFCIWYFLTVGNPDSFTVGTFFVLFAVVMMTVIVRVSRVKRESADANARVANNAGSQLRVSPVGLFKLLAYFLKSSMLGALDIAGTVLHREIDISPSLIRYPCALQDRWERNLFALMQNLLPGTLAVTSEDDALWIHVLRDNQQTVDQLMVLEELLAGAFHLRNAPINLQLKSPSVSQSLSSQKVERQ